MDKDKQVLKVIEFAKDNEKIEAEISLHNVDFLDKEYFNDWEIEHNRINGGQYFSVARKYFGNLKVTLFS